MLREREREKNVRFECCAVEKHDSPVLKAIVVVLLRVLNASGEISAHLETKVRVREGGRCECVDDSGRAIGVRTCEA